MLEESQMHFEARASDLAVSNPHKVRFQVERRDGLFKDQEIPQYVEETEQVETTGVKNSEGNRFKAPLIINEDPNITRFAHSRLVAVEKIASLIATLIFFLSCCKTEIDLMTGNPSNITTLDIMYAISVCTAALIIVITVRYICLFQLQVSQNKAYLRKSADQWWITAFILKSDHFKFLILQILIVLPHPFAGLQNATYQLFQTYNCISVNHSYNDALALMLIVKVYIIIRALVTVTDYCSPRASRLCYQNGFEHNLVYAMKCILRDQPLTTIAILFGIFMMVFGYGLKLAEGTLSLYNQGMITGFQQYRNCFWLVFITMSTVGYGDYFPKTLVGRCLIIVTAITGVLLTSLLIVSLSIYLQMESGQLKAHLTLQRLNQRKNLVEEASKALAETIKIHKVMSNPKGRKEKELKQKFTKLKGDIDSFRESSRREKSIVDSDNTAEEMDRLFYILKDSLKDIYLGQKKLREQISKIHDVGNIKTSFIKQLRGLLDKANSSVQAK